MKPICSALVVGALLILPCGQVQAQGPALETKQIEISRPGDLEMSCSKLLLEIAELETLIIQTREIQENTELASTGIGVGKAVGSYLVGSLAGGIGILAAGFIASQAADNRAELAEDLEDAAFQRRSFMAGIYNAKQCSEPLELAALEPAAGETVSPPKPLKKRKPYEFNQ